MLHQALEQPGGWLDGSPLSRSGRLSCTVCLTHSKSCTAANDARHQRLHLSHASKPGDRLHSGYKGKTDAAQVWGFANLEYEPGQALWDAVAQNCVASMHDYSPQNIANGAPARPSLATRCEMIALLRCALVPLMVLLMTHQPHLHQPWRLDVCIPSTHS